MIDVEREELISLKQACKLPELKRDGRGPHYCTLHRWIAAGKLETVVVGGLRMTSRAAIRRMIARDNPGIPTTSPRERQKQIRDAERRLAMAGV
ncbi:MAG TPA: DUF1580 domain-containing protein [Tepidisphaeraceae bacterium]|jgi:hypothetical protein